MKHYIQLIFYFSLYIKIALLEYLDFFPLYYFVLCISHVFFFASSYFSIVLNKFSFYSCGCHTIYSFIWLPLTVDLKYEANQYLWLLSA